MGPFTRGQIPATNQILQVNNDDGTARDLSGYNATIVKIVDSNGNDVPVTWTVAAYNPAFVGRVIVQWGTSASPFMTEGTYQLVLEFTSAGGAIDYTGTITFEVDQAPDGVSTFPLWASLGDVRALIGQDVDAVSLLAAQGIIDSISNRTPGVSASMVSRDVIWLQRAVCYQAAWMQGQPDLFTRSSMTEVSQDGVMGKYASQASLYLAPLAERCLRNVSWLRSRSLRIRSPFVDGDTSIYISPEANDLLENWQELGMVTGP